jgi:hypothetical protein
VSENRKNDVGEEPKSQEEAQSKAETKSCHECGKTYRTNYKLAEHMRKHTGNTRFIAGEFRLEFLLLHVGTIIIKCISHGWDFFSMINKLVLFINNFGN